MIKKNCLQCGKEFETYNCRKKAKFCCTKCYANSLIGKPSLLKGTKGLRVANSGSFKKGNPAPKTAFKKGIVFNKGEKNGMYGKRGELSPNWKGGNIELKYLIRGIPKYFQWRSDIFQRDNWTCQTCGKRGVKIEAHHIKQFSKILEEYNIKTRKDAEDCEELWDTGNGVTLCKECHKLLRKKYE